MNSIQKDNLVHDKDLFQLLLAEAKLINFEVRSGSMFGSPAVYCGRKMALCVHGTDIGMRVPAGIAAEGLRSGKVFAFQPHGKAVMKEWIKMKGSATNLKKCHDLIEAALKFAERNNVK
jgi:hypothetical protein